jgi:hypothetical protein
MGSTPIERLIMITPFQSSIELLELEEQLVMLKGCALCRITRDLDNNSTRSKAEWKSCKAQLGVPIDVITIDKISPAIAQAIENRAPAVCAATEDGKIILLLDQESLERCNGRIGDFRGRLMFRAASLDLTLNLPG